MNPHPLYVHPGLILREMTLGEEMEHMSDPSEASSGPSRSVDLPSHIQARILRYALCFPGDVVRK